MSQVPYLVAGAAALATGAVVVLRRRTGADEDAHPQLTHAGKPVEQSDPVTEVQVGSSQFEPASVMAPDVSIESPTTSTANDEQTDAETVADLGDEASEHADGLSVRMRGLRQRLSRSKGAVGDALLNLLGGRGSADIDWESVEDTLIMADFGVRPAQELVSRIKKRVSAGADVAAAREAVASELLTMLESPPNINRELNLVEPGTCTAPQIIVMVGVNGTGKTTTTGKLARALSDAGNKVVLAAADTFRAAAAEQLTTWAERTGVPVVSKPAGSDPAAVAFDALQLATQTGADVLLVDTAGRLHTKSGLMDELGKVLRVLERQTPVSEVLLVIDATTGQNGLAQARVFAEVAAVTGVVLTKLDGTAKGGIVVAVQQDLGVPVKLVGLGEGADDLAEFDAQSFVAAVVGD